MSENIRFRTATLTDLTVLQELCAATIDYCCSGDYDKEQRYVWKLGIENELRWRTVVEEQYMLIAEIDGALAGFGSLKNGSYVDFMYASRCHQRMGVALSIYRRLEAEKLKCDTSQLTADVSKTALPFFEKQGFEIAKLNNNLIQGIWITSYHMSTNIG